MTQHQKTNTNFSTGRISFTFGPEFWNLIQVERVWTKKTVSITAVKWNWQSNPWRQTVFTNFPYQSDNNMVKYLSWHWEAVFNWWSVWKHHVTRPVEGLLCNQVILDETGRYLSLEVYVWSVMYSKPSVMISESVSNERKKGRSILFVSEIFILVRFHTRFTDTLKWNNPRR